MVSAYFGGKTDLIIQRFMDICCRFPIIVLAITVVAVLGKNVVFGDRLEPRSSRSACRWCRRWRASCAPRRSPIREMPYIDAARTAGFSHARIIFRHIVPNVVAPYLIMLTAFVGAGDPRSKRRCRSWAWA